MKFIFISLITLAVNACAYDPPHGQSGKPGGDTVLVCHKGKKTLELPREAARAHLSHGDRYGSC